MSEKKEYPSRLSPRDKSALNPNSAKLAVAAYCYHNCLGEEEANSHRTKRKVRDCKNTQCSLWEHRGWQQITGGSVKAD